MNAKPFNPERGLNEATEAYRARRAAHRRHVQRLTLTGKYSCSGGISSRQQLRDARRKNGGFKGRLTVSQLLMADWAERRVAERRKAMR